MLQSLVELKIIIEIAERRNKIIEEILAEDWLDKETRQKTKSSIVKTQGIISNNAYNIIKRRSDQETATNLYNSANQILEKLKSREILTI